ncbi:hypothetical protein BSKO_08118 [Bryopsis sp. KO-2023]|nr:hypothetical protein BSKO_08118 [Bryopsis sp. KO-2023]
MRMRVSEACSSTQTRSLRRPRCTPATGVPRRTMSLEKSVLFVFFALAFFCNRSSSQLIDTRRAEKAAAESYVRALASRAEKLHSARREPLEACTCSVPSCWICGSENTDGIEGCTLSGVECDDQQRPGVETTTVRTPPGTETENLNARLRESICLYRSLKSEVDGNDPSLQRSGTTYIGTMDGHFRAWVGEETDVEGKNGEEASDGDEESCSDFDPRWRRWFVAPSTGPKDVVIGVDTSAAMLREVAGTSRWLRISKAIGTLCGSFTSADFFNVVGFANSAQTVFPTGLVSGVRGNAGEKLRSGIGQLMARGDRPPASNLQTALSSAFDMLEPSDQVGGSSACTKVLLLIVAKIDCGYQTPGAACNDPEAVHRFISAKQRNLVKKTGQKAMIFTIGIGGDVDDSLLQQIACRNLGSYVHVPDGEDPLPALTSYQAFLAAGRISKDAVWLTPEDGDPGEREEQVAILARPFYSENETGVFLGVVAHEVAMSSIRLEWPDAVRTCEEVDSSACRLQAIRQYVGSGETCVAQNLPNIPCYKFNTKWYWVVSPTTRKSWTGAQILCKGQGGELAFAESDMELGMLATVAHSLGSWVGAKKSPDGAFRWEGNGASEVKSDYWARSHPDSGKECARIDPRGLNRNMVTDDCNKELPFICKFDVEPDVCGQASVSISENRIYPKCKKEQAMMQAIEPIEEISTVLPGQAPCPLESTQLNGGNACSGGTNKQIKRKPVEKIKGREYKQSGGKLGKESGYLIEDDVKSDKASEAKILGMDKILLGCIAGAGGVIVLGLALMLSLRIKRRMRVPTRPPQWETPS